MKRYVFFSHSIYKRLLTIGFQETASCEIDLIDKQKNKKQTIISDFKYFKYICSVKMTNENVRFH